MGAIGGFLGIGPSSSASSGGRYDPTMTPLMQTTNPQQIQDQYAQAQQAIQQQQSFLTALQGQGGIQNQSAVYNQLSNIAAGQGPNPAQAMLAQATGQNAAQTGALMAGQRGAGQNVGLIARQAGQQGANLQQQAASQAALMQAQQSLGAIGQMGGLATQQVAQQAGATMGLMQGTQAEQQQILGAAQALNQAQVQQQMASNAIKGKLAEGAQQAQYGLIGGAMQGAGSALGLARGGEVKKYPDGGQVATSTPTTPPIPEPSSTPAQPTFQGKSKTGKFLSSAQPTTGSSGISQSAFKAGESVGSGIARLFSSSSTPTQVTKPVETDVDLAHTVGTGMYSDDEQALNADIATQKAVESGEIGNYADGGIADNLAKLAPLAMMLAARGGKVPAMVSPGEIYVPPHKVHKVASGRMPAQEAGKKFSGKAKVKGDSLKNDTVKTTLDEGGIVIPRSIVNSKDPVKNATKFVQHILAKNRK